MFIFLVLLESLNKSLTDKEAEFIWNEIIRFGYEPFEIHNQKFNIYDPNGINFNKKESLRWKNSTIVDFIDKIKECKYFFGIDSGPFYLAGSIIGYENCFGLQKEYAFDKYIPLKIHKIEIKKVYVNCITHYFAELKWGIKK